MTSQPKNLSKLLSSRQLLEIWPVSQMTLWRHLQKGTIPQPIQLGRRRYWRSDDISAWLGQMQGNIDDAA